jgi:putative endonuclease
VPHAVPDEGAHLEVVRMRAKDGLGRYGEDVAARHLVEQGIIVLERNWRCDIGEIDIVGRDGDVLVVCEVKTRSGTGFGTPLEAVTRAKAARLRRLAARWLADHQGRPAHVRFDVVGVLAARSGAARVEHVRGVLA